MWCHHIQEESRPQTSSGAYIASDTESNLVQEYNETTTILVCEEVVVVAFMTILANEEML